MLDLFSERGLGAASWPEEYGMQQREQAARTALAGKEELEVELRLEKDQRSVSLLLFCSAIGGSVLLLYMVWLLLR